MREFFATEKAPLPPLFDFSMSTLHRSGPFAKYHIVIKDITRLAGTSSKRQTGAGLPTNCVSHGPLYFSDEHITTIPRSSETLGRVRVSNLQE